MTVLKVGVVQMIEQQLLFSHVQNEGLEEDLATLS